MHYTHHELHRQQIFPIEFSGNIHQASCGHVLQSVLRFVCWYGSRRHALQELGYQIIVNDLQYYGYVLNRHYIGNHTPLQFNGLKKILPIANLSQPHAVCDYLSNIKGAEGFLYQNYAPTGSQQTDIQRQYFSDVETNRNIKGSETVEYLHYVKVRKSP